jgi:hypothetical protein
LWDACLIAFGVKELLCSCIDPKFSALSSNMHSVHAHSEVVLSKINVVKLLINPILNNSLYALYKHAAAAAVVVFVGMNRILSFALSAAGIV